MALVLDAIRIFFSIFSNSKTNASESLENGEKIFLRYYMYIDICSSFNSTITQWRVTRHDRTLSWRVTNCFVAKLCLNQVLNNR